MLLFQDAWWNARSDCLISWQREFNPPKRVKQNQTTYVFFPYPVSPQKKNIHWKMQLCSLVGHGFQASGYCDLEPLDVDGLSRRFLPKWLKISLFHPNTVDRPCFVSEPSSYWLSIHSLIITSITIPPPKAMSTLLELATKNTRHNFFDIIDLKSYPKHVFKYGSKLVTGTEITILSKSELRGFTPSHPEEVCPALDFCSGGPSLVV